MCSSNSRVSTLHAVIGNRQTVRRLSACLRNSITQRPSYDLDLHTHTTHTQGQSPQTVHSMQQGLKAMILSPEGRVVLTRRRCVVPGWWIENWTP